MFKRAFFFAAIGVASLASVQAQLVHRYDMNSVNDSVGTANGTLQGGATISGGVLTVNGANNGAGTNSQALALPASVGTGITANFSLEFYATRPLTAGNDYSSVFSFATAQNNLLLFNPARGDASGTNFNLQQPGISGGGEQHVRPTPAGFLFADGAQHDIVVTYDATSGVANIYNNGTLFATGTPGAGYNFQSISNGAFNGIGGNAPYSDPSFNGTVADFRVYTQALSQAQVTRLNAIGADATNAAITAALVPEPSTWTAALAGVAALLGLQRFRRSLV